MSSFTVKIPGNFVHFHEIFLYSGKFPHYVKRKEVRRRLSGFQSTQVYLPVTERHQQLIASAAGHGLTSKQ